MSKSTTPVTDEHDPEEDGRLRDADRHASWREVYDWCQVEGWRP